jgi:hypothetical protein
VEDQEALHSRAVVGELADAVQREIDDFLADGVVAPRVVVRRVFLAVDDLLRMEELALRAGSDLIDDGGLDVDEDGARNMLAGARLREEGVEGVVAHTDGLSDGIWPSGWIPCSRQYSSQQPLPIWTPAWPVWMEITSRIVEE